MIDWKSKNFWIAVGFALLIPILLNFTIFKFGAPWNLNTYGSRADWIAFFGNYLGGILSALVAYFIANSQVEKQLKINLEEKKFDRTINQLPALIRLRIELEKFVEESKKAKREWDGTLEAHNGIVKYPTDDDYDPEAPGIEESYLLEATYPMELADSESFKFIEQVEDIDLHVRLIEAFNFYKEFSTALSYDVHSEQSKYSDYTQDDTGTVQIPSDLREEINLMIARTENASRKKIKMWRIFFEKDVEGKLKKLKEFESLLGELNDEIERVKTLKDTNKLTHSNTSKKKGA
ncbi:hypothetical protein [Domibacillus sp.]|uniref:hypothetical protein n=1 Tax=Domibacillus sp. TaxID=1969783 RepID=UPI0028115D8B|nr:hypothetical protein [Domibacillus sp.]